MLINGSTDCLLNNNFFFTTYRYFIRFFAAITAAGGRTFAIPLPCPMPFHHLAFLIYSSPPIDACGNANGSGKQQTIAKRRRKTRRPFFITGWRLWVERYKMPFLANIGGRKGTCSTNRCGRCRQSVPVGPMALPLKAGQFPCRTPYLVHDCTPIPFTLLTSSRLEHCCPLNFSQSVRHIRRGHPPSLENPFTTPLRDHRQLSDRHPLTHRARSQGQR